MQIAARIARSIATGTFAAAALAPLMATAAPPERPYGGSCSTVVVPVTPPEVVPQELHITYECTLAHLGRTTAQVTQFVTPTSQSGPFVALALTNKTVYTAASGDQLLATFTGSAVLDVRTAEVAFSGVEVFSGGSGRFSQATGSAHLEGTASIVTNRGFFWTKGRISY